MEGWGATRRLREEEGTGRPSAEQGGQSLSADASEGLFVGECEGRDDEMIRDITWDLTRDGAMNMTRDGMRDVTRGIHKGYRCCGT